MKFKASNYQTRSDLETDVRNKVKFLTAEAKDTYTIEGTREDLARLKLTDRTTFWGISCVITDEPTEVKKGKKPDRGSLKGFGINNRNQKPI